MNVFNGAALLGDVILLYPLALHLVVNVPGHGNGVEVAGKVGERGKSRVCGGGGGGGGGGGEAHFGSGASDWSSISVMAPLVSDTPVWGCDQHHICGWESDLLVQSSHFEYCLVSHR